MRIRFLRPAQAELQEASSYYESQAPNLGAAFLIEVVSAMERLSQFPEAWQQIETATRRCQLNRFPYALIYAVEDLEVVILSVADLRRRPRTWRDRLKRDS